MSDNTKIEWADATLNYANGCSLASPGCTNCYAMKQAHRFPVRQGLTIQSKGGMVWTGEVRINDKALFQALAWKRGRHIFWNAHGDLFHEKVTDAEIDRLFAVCALTPQHTHMILTKRSARMRKYMRRIYAEADWIMTEIENLAPEADSSAWQVPMANVWLGVSVEDQTRADERIPDLLAIPAAVRFLSCEPLLGPVDLTRIHEEFDGGLGHSWESCLNGKRFSEWSGDGNGGDIDGCPRIDWVIVGGESGPGARPMHPDWARRLRDQCAAAGVPFHFKQWGEHIAHPAPGAKWKDGSPVPADLHPVTFERIGKKRAGRLLDGVEHNGLPGSAAA